MQPCDPYSMSHSGYMRGYITSVDNRAPDPLGRLSAPALPLRERTAHPQAISPLGIHHNLVMI